ncbi:peptidoglycan-binding domain-containing protein [Roseivivax isoporae]|uniref:Peptidoglycan-binding protein n=1 Tax=Roseivivax isoporae LMG 25204 TaxID=1449351 RepID=X7F670_9RHOB|nr:peptidoglycan-binding domain-containing protein [Roseivivax isoporae]ETX27529.1 peptidoglycan-binding protein [Roseivivax isoporae LMG 25204]
MRFRRVAATAALSALALVPVPAVANDAFVGGLVGGIIGGAISNAQPKTRTVYREAPRRSTSTRSAPRTTTSTNSYEREQNRTTQTALNYFGFDAGVADGIMGSRSRSAVSAYQAHLGYSPTGQLTQYERDFLVSSFHRAQAGGPATAQLVASNPQGVKGLLTVYRDEQLNGAGSTATASIGGHYGLPSVVASAVNEIAKSSDPTAEQLVSRSGFIQLSDINGDGKTDYIIDTSVTGSAFWCNAQSCAVRVFASTPDGYERNDFQAFNVTPAMFSCTRGTCTKTDGGTPQLAGPVTQAPGQQTLPQTQLAATTPAPLAPAATPVASAQPVVQGGAAAIPSFGATAPAIPSFGAAEAKATLASECNRINLLATTNGGFSTVATMTDATATMGEQLCLVRTYAIALGEDLMGKVQGVSRAQIAEQCAGFAPLLAPIVTGLAVKPREAVVQDAVAFVQSSGMAPAQLENTARICLSSAYSEDRMDLAMGAAVLMVALGHEPYGEVVGHHLALGMGAAPRQDLAAGWYTAALGALEGGATPVFAPGQTERAALLRKASTAMNGRAADDAIPQTQEASLPVFAISE